MYSINLTLSAHGAIVLRITSFHGRGFFPSALPPHPWTTELAVIEAAIDFLPKLVFVATFSRRLLGN